MRPQTNARGARPAAPASHYETPPESTDLPPAMAALGGDYIAELALARPDELARAIGQLARETRATAHRARAWRLFRSSYAARAERMRQERLRRWFAEAHEPTARAVSIRAALVEALEGMP